MVVATAFELGATHLNPQLRPPDRRIRRAEPAFHRVRRRMRAARQNLLADVRIPEPVIDPARTSSTAVGSHIDSQAADVEPRRRVRSTPLPRPPARSSRHRTREARVGRDGGRDVEVAVVGGPTKRGAQVGEFGGEPLIGLSLARAVPPAP